MKSALLRQALALLALPFLVALSGCSSTSDDPSVQAVNTCIANAETAVHDQAILDSTHPLWELDVPGPEAPLDEIIRYDSMRADEESQWESIVLPLYETCKGPGELFAAMKKYPAIAGFNREEALSPIVVEAWCWDAPIAGLPACEGWEEWVAASTE